MEAIKKVHVIWDDAQTQDGWDSPEGVIKNIGDPYTCETIGWLIDQNDKNVIVCHTRNNIAVCGAISIPIGIVREIKTIK